MNIRNLIKLRKVALSEVQDRAYDNFHEHKLEVWHGPKEAPFHDAVCLTDDELKKFVNNLNYVYQELKSQMELRLNESEADSSDDH